MPYYKRMLIDVVNQEKFLKEKLCELIEKWFKLGWIHYDIAFRNIGIDDNGNYQLIDLNEFCEIPDCYRKERAYYLFTYIKSDLESIGRLDIYEMIEQIADKFVFTDVDTFKHSSNNFE